MKPVLGITSWLAFTCAACTGSAPEPVATHSRATAPAASAHADRSSGAAGAAMQTTTPSAQPPGLLAPAADQSALAPRDSGPAATPARARIEALLQRLAPGLSRSTDGLSWRTTPSGARSLDLHGHFGHAMLATRGKDGALRITCVDNLPAARRVLEAAERSAP